MAQILVGAGHNTFCTLHFWVWAPLNCSGGGTSYLTSITGIRRSLNWRRLVIAISIPYYFIYLWAYGVFYDIRIRQLTISVFAPSLLLFYPPKLEITLPSTNLPSCAFPEYFLVFIQKFYTHKSNRICHSKKKIS